MSWIEGKKATVKISLFFFPLQHVTVLQKVHWDATHSQGVNLYFLWINTKYTNIFCAARLIKQQFVKCHIIWSMYFIVACLKLPEFNRVLIKIRSRMFLVLSFSSLWAQSKNYKPGLNLASSKHEWEFLKCFAESGVVQSLIELPSVFLKILFSNLY